jgi:hypothetical protein
MASTVISYLKEKYARGFMAGWQLFFNQTDLVRETSHHSSRGFHNLHECPSKHTTATQCVNIEWGSTTQINKEKTKIEEKIQNSSLQWGLVLLLCQS